MSIEWIPRRLKDRVRRVHEPSEQLSERQIENLQRPRSTQVVGVSTKGAPRGATRDAQHSTEVTR